ncbi:hypothetical protein ACFV9C_42550 [Kribbella sp. NPDC059898]|uniref:hypothetical protein n=1 Tax=Kribbella sp. NPDC059898 TaxID=3346995 RepID=UPI00364E4B72
MIATTTVLLLVATTGTAAADTGKGSAPAMSPFDLQDTHGIKISQYELNIDQGGLSSPFKLLWAAMLMFGWELYRWWIGMIAWLLDWAVTFSWLDLFTKPLTWIGNALEGNVIGPSNLLTTSILFGAVGIAFFVARGHYGRAGIEFLVTAAILALATTGLAHPVTWLTSPHGPLYTARGVGIELANTVTTNGATSGSDPAALKQNTSGVLIDTFIRQPHQLLNYGANIDSDATCAPVYDNALKAGPYGDDSAARDQIGKCNKAYKDYADNPGAGQITTQFFLMPTGGLLALVVGLLTLLMMASVGLASWSALKLMWHTMIGLIPGTSRRGLAKSIADVLIHVMLIPILLVFLCSFLYMLKSVMAANANMVLVARFIIADLLLLVGLVVMWRLWRNHQELAARVAGMLNVASDAARNVGVGDTAKLTAAITKGSINPAVKRWSLPNTTRPPGTVPTRPPGTVPTRPTANGTPGTAGGQAATGGMKRLKGLAGKATGRMENTAVGRQTLGIGRDTVATGKALGKAARTTAKYTVGAPVSYPAAASKMAGKWSQASSQRREGMKKKLGAAKEYAGTYKNNTKAATRGVAKVGARPAKVAAKTAAKVGTAALKKSHPAVAAAGLFMAGVNATKKADATKMQSSVRRPHQPEDANAKTTRTRPSRPPESEPAVVAGLGPKRPVQRKRAEQMKAYLKSINNADGSGS